MAQSILLRRGTSSQWLAADPILAEGELGVELNTGRLKVGDGVHKWSELSYTDDPRITIDGGTLSVSYDIDKVVGGGDLGDSFSGVRAIYDANNILI